GKLELMELFSASSTATQPAGQIDYVAANEYLNAFAQGRKGAATRVMAVDWGVWSQVGMAADAMAARQGAGKPGDRVECDQPLLQQTGFDAAGNRLFVSTWDAQEAWVFDQHRTAAGDALLPGTGYVELAAEAMAAHGIDVPYEIRDLYFLRPLRVADASPRRAVLRLEPEEAALNLTVHSALGPDEAAGHELNAQAQILPRPHLAAPAALDLAAIAARCGTADTAAAGDRLHSPQEAHLRFGPRWHVLRRRALGAGEGLATLALPQQCHGDLAKGYLMHPGLLDLATGWAIALAPGYDGKTLWVPVCYHAIRVLAPLPGEIRSWVRLSPGEAADGYVSFDVTLTDPQGNICVEIEGFQMTRTGGTLDFSAPAKPDAQAADLGLVAAIADTPLTPEELRLRHNIGQGIRPEEGPEALTRALALGLPQVLVSTLELPALIAQAARVSAPKAEEDQSFDRPDLDTDYVAPRTEVEKTLAGLFSSLLGVSRVGIEDSFFDLGGHSLIAVRLFARISRLYNVEFPLSTLFEAPSVAQLAALIAARTGITGDLAEGEEAPRAEAAPAFTHLVALHKGGSSSRTPFFLVAGMFGNVLNLRHLALMLGRDRPVWGLQARGLIGGDEPHRRMEEAAADYLAEIRQVQPHGPYLLGGFSGGGITAYEMARQLEAEGEEVALLVMLDTPLPVRPELSGRDKALIKMQELRRKGAGYLGEWAGNRIRWELQKRRGTPALVSTGTSFNNAGIEAAFRDSLLAYDLKPWTGPMVLFRPPLDRHWKVSGGNWVSAAREYVFADNQWTAWVPRTRVIEVPGDHDSMVLVPNVSVLAEKMKAVIDRAEAGQPPDSPEVAAITREAAE
ncbi:MAG: polyketide synthase dehydratase domain-containing protein, partial [Pseudodonghicola sp.]